jgi:L-asparaginase
MQMTKGPLCQAPNASELTDNDCRHDGAFILGLGWCLVVNVLKLIKPGTIHDGWGRQTNSFALRVHFQSFKMLSSVHVFALSLSALALAAPLDPLARQNLVIRHEFPQLITRQDIQSPINASLPNVTIFATGGTIASQGTTNTQTVGYQVGLGVQQLVDAVPEILNISNINGYQISNVDSGSINETISLKLAHMINAELAKDEISGVVITHGTDTLEETAFFLESTVNSSKPVVIVGAMRPATALSADGPLNLLQAVTLAVSENAKNRGVMITLNE